MSSVPSSAAAELFDVLAPMRRAVRRRVREGWPLEPLPTAQVDLLRAVALRPGISVGQAAAELRIAPNTASTLVNQLVAAGLVERVRDEGDRRLIRLGLTETAETRIRSWRDRRREVLEAALETLDRGDRRSIEAALPALRRLAAELDR